MFRRESTIDSDYITILPVATDDSCERTNKLNQPMSKLDMLPDKREETKSTRYISSLSLIRLLQ